MKILANLQRFINDRQSRKGLPNVWIHDDKMEVYVRHGHHLIEGEITDTLDIANITVYKRGKGTFSKFLPEAHKLNPWPVTFIENVLDERFQRWFERNGWQRVITLPNCFYKRTIYNQE